VGKQMQCKDVAVAMGISPQKCSALLTQLVKDGRVERTQEKKSGPALFSVPEVEEGE
jgi:predicted transcriptional regulator